MPKVSKIYPITNPWHSGLESIPADSRQSIVAIGLDGGISVGDGMTLSAFYECNEFVPSRAIAWCFANELVAAVKSHD